MPDPLPPFDRANPWTRSWCCQVACMYGWVAVVSGTLGVVLAAIALYCSAVLFLRTGQGMHINRKILFMIVFVLGMIRSCYSFVLLNRFLAVDSWLAAEALVDYTNKTFVPMNAVCDALASVIDVVLTLFWCKMLKNPFAMKHATAATVAYATAAVVVSAVCITVDIDDKNWAYPVTLFTISSMLMVTAVLHLVTIALLLRRLTKNATLLSTSCRRQAIIVLGIAAITSVCWLTRTVILILTALGSSTVRGNHALSLQNPTFSVLYFVLLMVSPLIITTLLFFKLTVALNKEADPLTVRMMSFGTVLGVSSFAGVNVGGDGGSGKGGDGQPFVNVVDPDSPESTPRRYNTL